MGVMLKKPGMTEKHRKHWRPYQIETQLLLVFVNGEVERRGEKGKFPRSQSSSIQGIHSQRGYKWVSRDFETPGKWKIHKVPGCTRIYHGIEMLLMITLGKCDGEKQSWRWCNASNSRYSHSLPEWDRVFPESSGQTERKCPGNPQHRQHRSFMWRSRSDGEIQVPPNCIGSGDSGNSSVGTGLKGGCKHKLVTQPSFSQTIV